MLDNYGGIITEVLQYDADAYYIGFNHMKNKEITKILFGIVKIDVKLNKVLEKHL